jgi:hypothetical protein
MIKQISFDCAQLLADAEVELSSIRATVATHALTHPDLPPEAVPVPRALRRETLGQTNELGPRY